MKLDQLKNEIDKIRQYKPLLDTIVSNHGEIIIIGNGGSNSVASHISQDYTKQLGKRCISFSDPSRLTCYINDYGRDEAYVEFLKNFADKDTLIILMSSSGNSMNIFNCAVFCKKHGIKFISLSGFSEDNKLNTFDGGLLKYWVDSYDYGVVETSHQILLHSILGEDD
tara:strand:+ start:467 stop:970 length:504 start_codon:yes stop_codon:yes gene_type:complete